MNTEGLAQALDTVLWHKAKRFINNPGYIAHIQKCVDDLQLTDTRLAFLFGGWMLCSKTSDRLRR